MELGVACDSSFHSKYSGTICTGGFLESIRGCHFDIAKMLIDSFNVDPNPFFHFFTVSDASNKGSFPPFSATDSTSFHRTECSLEHSFLSLLGAQESSLDILRYFVHDQCMHLGKVAIKVAKDSTHSLTSSKAIDSLSNVSSFPIIFHSSNELTIWQTLYIFRSHLCNEVSTDYLIHQTIISNPDIELTELSFMLWYIHIDLLSYAVDKYRLDPHYVYKPRCQHSKFNEELIGAVPGCTILMQQLGSSLSHTFSYSTINKIIVKMVRNLKIDINAQDYAGNTAAIYLVRKLGHNNKNLAAHMKQIYDVGGNLLIKNDDGLDIFDMCPQLLTEIPSRYGAQILGPRLVQLIS